MSATVTGTIDFGAQNMYYSQGGSRAGILNSPMKLTYTATRTANKVTISFGTWSCGGWDRYHSATTLVGVRRRAGSANYTIASTTLSTTNPTPSFQVNSTYSFTFTALPTDTSYSMQFIFYANDPGSSTYEWTCSSSTLTKTLTIPAFAPALYGSVNGTARPITKLYGSVNGSSVKINKLYGSVNGVAKRIF